MSAIRDQFFPEHMTVHVFRVAAALTAWPEDEIELLRAALELMGSGRITMDDLESMPVHVRSGKLSRRDALRFLVEGTSS
jgi:hypothetical protein